MATSSINITLPEPLKAYVEAQADSGAFGTPSDFIRELILDDRDRRRRNLEEHLLNALKHEDDSVEISDEVWEHGDIVAVLEEHLTKLA
jgi:antitoxin ParD1/3/4